MNIYSDPEHFGLEVFGTIDAAPGSYEFDYLVVWREKATGQLWWASDSGCSCPTPFEDFSFPNRGDHVLRKVNTARGFSRTVADFLGEWEYRREATGATAQAEALVRKVREYLENREGSA